MSSAARSYPTKADLERDTMTPAKQSAAQMPNWKVIVNDGPTKIVPASNIMVAMHRGLERIGLIDTKIEKLEVRRVRD